MKSTLQDIATHLRKQFGVESVRVKNGYVEALIVNTLSNGEKCRERCRYNSEGDLIS